MPLSTPGGSSYGPPFIYTFLASNGSDPGAGQFTTDNATVGSISSIKLNVVQKNGAGIDLSYALNFASDINTFGMILTSLATGKTSAFQIGSWTSPGGVVTYTVTPHGVAASLSGDYSVVLTPIAVLAATTPDLADVLAVGNDANALEIVNVLDPTTAQSAATKNYADTQVTATWADDAARASAVPTKTGQLGIQLDNKSLWESTSTTAGNWSPITLLATEQTFFILSKIGLINAPVLYVDTAGNLSFQFYNPTDGSGTGSLTVDSSGIVSLVGPWNAVTRDPGDANTYIATTAYADAAVAAAITALKSDATALAAFQASAGITPVADGTVTPVTSITTQLGIVTADS